MPAPAVSPIITALAPLRAAAPDLQLSAVQLSSSFLTALAAVPDPRRGQGRRRALSTILALVICAVLAGADNYSQIAAWIADSDEHTRHTVGAGPVMVSESAMRKTLQRLDADAVDVVTCAWISSRDRAAAAKGQNSNRRLRVLALDGKTLRGSATRTRTCDQPGRHLLAVFDTATAIVVAQVDVGAKTNEITRFATVLDGVNLQDAVVTADALHAQRAHADYLHGQRGGHYLMTVKGNQPSLYAALSGLPFDASPVQASSFDRDHGRTEERHVKALELPDHVGDLGFAGAAQAVRIVRRRLEHSSGKLSVEVVYAITSLPAELAGVYDLADIARAHWHVENRLHHVRDVTFAEDACRVRTGAGPRVLASVRNLALGVLRLAGEVNIAAARARLARRPERPIQLLQGM
ncbi:MAG: ISAs1 family transposase [Janthinobacterium lividum]